MECGLDWEWINSGEVPSEPRFLKVEIEGWIAPLLASFS